MKFRPKKPEQYRANTLARGRQLRFSLLLSSSLTLVFGCELQEP